MAAPGDREGRRNLFGRAFLIQLARNDLDLARVFAKAFLVEARAEPLNAPPEIAG